MMRGVDGVLQSISSICHFLALLLGGLRAEKISIAATAKKYEARIVHLDSMVTQLTQQVMSFGINYMFYGSDPCTNIFIEFPISWVMVSKLLTTPNHNK